MSQPAAPSIPDYQILRRIGVGSYGDVWLGKGVTGAFRAIKVVHRSNFDDEATFEREFDGILQYEQRSRENPGLVAILHVGRNTEDGFYYYVMELGDDVERGADVNPIDYEPRTLQSDVRRAGRLPLEECLQIGMTLAGALEHLHVHGLAHRDIKPANVIFVNGRAKLADVGLVAPVGRRSFVGTMGFVPPEGPGTPAADVYSLGMVLYEISSGRDRMDFPELPEDFDDAEQWALWRSLNDVLCQACAPVLDDRLDSAAVLGEMLSDVAEGREVRRVNARKRRVRWVGVVGMVAFVALVGVLVSTLAGWQSAGDAVGDVDGWRDGQPVISAEDAARRGGSGGTGVEMPDVAEMTSVVKFISEPEAAEVYHNGELIATTPQTVDDLGVGPQVFVFRKTNHRDEVVEVDLRDGRRNVVAATLGKWQPPRAGVPWRNEFGMLFAPSGDEHVSITPVTTDVYREFVGLGPDMLQSTLVEVVAPDGGSESVDVVMLSERKMKPFAEWLTRHSILDGFMSEEDYYVFAANDKVPAKTTSGGEVLRAYDLVVRKRVFGGVHLITSPPGAMVSDSGGRILPGVTPLVLERLKPGSRVFEFHLDGYETRTVTVDIEANEVATVNVDLPESRGVVFSRPWTNSLEMKFVPNGGLMWSIWETRVQDWRRFEEETGREALRAPLFKQGPTHPWGRASREDAEAFCEWLTRKERAEGLIRNSYEYRLPTDREWSLVVGLDEAPHSEPVELDGVDTRQFPWGRQFPPPNRVGNYADDDAPPFLQRLGVLDGYVDGARFTAPVGSYAPSKSGLYDLGGNVWEWVSDPYGGRMANHAVCRGASWGDARRDTLLSSMRNVFSPDYRGDGLYGFRVVIARVPAESFDPFADGPAGNGRERRGEATDLGGPLRDSGADVGTSIFDFDSDEMYERTSE
ncbi:protein kinase domain-containing protein [Sulfuriroseicoccus oceanibius]|uniref:SUMF1/EgtB/PvdO family nonheme iron enzyme n=1 Tax=Sulfuriroseicoccus oceanibius TaxID=2707525 RepID=A0A6B3L9E6_9BACT|nr:SUMF1/EgtB/PvdO family nonheme iron enzyme [Sulfuriroseicoccus oceanibius]QQL44224.1 SUMF1/EgtB/PvdO family nonheme iron enzyme [Sulfuriroseicoccus oceanibius]